MRSLTRNGFRKGLPHALMTVGRSAHAHNSRRKRLAIVHNERRALLLRASLAIVGLGSTGHLELS
jgi:hypothetical protein